MSVLPASIRQKPLAGWSEETVPTYVEMPTDAGPPKRRRRTDYVRRIRTFELELNGTQKGDLDTFFHTTLNGGVDTFTWTAGDPVTGGDVEYRFIEPPIIQHVLGAAAAANRRYITVIRLEVIA